MDWPRIPCICRPAAGLDRGASRRNRLSLAFGFWRVRFGVSIFRDGWIRIGPRTGWTRHLAKPAGCQCGRFGLPELGNVALAELGNEMVVWTTAGEHLLRLARE